MEAVRPKYLPRTISPWRLLLATALALLPGCAATLPPAPRVVDVPVPVACPAPVIPARPALPVAALTSRSTDAETARAYAGSVVTLQGYSEELRTMLEGYAHGR